ncbi:GntR family transcriptional regulator [Jiangella rhizosphaerae]|uniref:GntR family transcriptional regulator n=1 Tax=Jiangella rhizosphaerae TaxID=2293569 RepID=A0A418KFX7_9ACTN|nr:GntR family transcriptional regulator [Jiangella rhizosphaerae]RIQ10832.1 GntR family transcriptional regulator [Jiangella rhizosphaerae]
MTDARNADHKSGRVRSHLERLIDDGLQPHDKLPTERQLADELGVSRMTVRHALNALEADRRVYRVHGSGTFVAEPTIDKTIRLTSFTEDMIERGMKPGTRVIDVGTEYAGATVGSKLNLSPAATVVRIRRVRLADGAPVCLETVHLDAARVEGLLDRELSGSLYELLASHYGTIVSKAEQRIAATVLEPGDAELLDVAPFSAALVVERRTTDQHLRPVEFTRSLYRADRYSFLIDIER